jgi:hypothetical protein
MGIVDDIDPGTFGQLLEGARTEVRVDTVYRVDEVMTDDDGPYWVYRTVDTDEWITVTIPGEMTPPFVEWLAHEGIRAELAFEDDYICSVGRSADGKWHGWVMGLFIACDDRAAATAYVQKTRAQFNTTQTTPTR